MSRLTIINNCTILCSIGASRGGFRGVSEVSAETTQDFPSSMGVALFRYNVSQGIHSGLNSGVNWPLFQLLVKEMQ